MTGTTVIRKQKFVAYKLPNHPFDPQEPFPDRKEKALHGLAKDIADELATHSIEDQAPVISRYEVHKVPNSLGEMLEVVCKYQVVNPSTTLTTYVKYRNVGEHKGDTLWSEPLDVTADKEEAERWMKEPDVCVTSFTVKTPDLFDGPPPTPRRGTRYYRRGVADGIQRKPLSDCPYPEGGQRWVDWVAGWMYEAKKRLAKARGIDDHHRGVLISQCPYDDHDLVLSSEWCRGWREAQLEAIRDSLKGAEADRITYGIWFL